MKRILRKHSFGSMRCILLFLGVLCAMPGFAQEEINQVDAMGRKDGPWQKRYPDSEQIRYIGQFEHDLPVDTFIYFYPNGVKSSEVVFQLDGNAQAKFFHQNGLVMGEGPYLDQKKHGDWVLYDNQSIKSAEERYENGERQGISRIYYLNGQVSAEVPYVKGVKHGPFVEYFPSGEIKIKGTYKDDSYDGEYVQYYGTDRVLRQGWYKNALRDSLWVEFDSDGKLKYQILYDEGVVVKKRVEEEFKPVPIPVDIKEEDKMDEGELMEKFYDGTGG